MDFSTVSDRLEAAGSAAGSAVQALRAADCWSALDGVAALLPGAGAGPAAQSYSGAWTTYFAGWCQQAEQHAESLTSSGRAYTSTEQRNAADLGAAAAPAVGSRDVPGGTSSLIRRALG